VLRVQQVASRLNCSAATVYALVESGRLGHHRCPGVRVSEEQLAAYLEATRRERGNSPVKTNPPRPRLKHITVR
jgi:excisionase family DNA binding protein